MVGGGAAGLLAAVEAARASSGRLRVVVLEAAREPARKILVSGGGRCNILPMEDAPDRFVSGSAPRLVRRCLDRFPLAEQRRFFEKLLGGPLREEPASRKLFPPSNRARDVRDALAALARESGVELRCGRPVRALRRKSSAGLAVDLDGESLDAEAVVLATGGRSVLAAGADGRGFEMAKELGHTVRSTFPALVPLVATTPHPHGELSGISLEGEVTAQSGDERAVGRGGFLFTHRGYSGPAALNVSHVVERSLLAGRAFDVRLRILGAPGAEPVRDWEATLLASRGTLQGLLRRHLPDRLAGAVLAAASLPDGPLAQLPRPERVRLVSALEGFPLPVSGTEGYRTAEVTGGGIPLEEIDPGSGESRLEGGLFLAGEILDVFGPIGGFNFQWAWATGRTAGLGAARRALRVSP